MILWQKLPQKDIVKDPDYSDLLDTIGSNLAEINDTLSAILSILENKQSNGQV